MARLAEHEAQTRAFKSNNNSLTLILYLSTRKWADVNEWGKIPERRVILCVRRVMSTKGIFLEQSAKQYYQPEWRTEHFCEITTKATLVRSQKELEVFTSILTRQRLWPHSLWVASFTETLVDQWRTTNLRFTLPCLASQRLGEFRHFHIEILLVRHHHLFDPSMSVISTSSVQHVRH